MKLAYQGIFQNGFGFHRHVDYSASAAILETREGQTPSGYPHVSFPFRHSLIGWRYLVGPATQASRASGDEVGLSLVNSVTLASRRCRVSRYRAFPSNRISWKGTMDPSSRLQTTAELGLSASAEAAPPELSLPGLFVQLGYPA